ncbi:MAG: acyl carrier protein [bacterium]|nr:acyl carrier protein [bacterium]
MLSIEQEILKIITERLGLDDKDVTKDSSLTRDLNASQLEITDLILALQEKFHIKIPEEELGDLDKVGNIINYISEHFDEPSAL